MWSALCSGKLVQINLSFGYDSRLKGMKTEIPPEQIKYMWNDVCLTSTISFSFLHGFHAQTPKMLELWKSVILTNYKKQFGKEPSKWSAGEGFKVRGSGVALD